jgi:hypothetical protein
MIAMNRNLEKGGDSIAKLGHPIKGTGPFTRRGSEKIIEEMALLSTSANSAF